MSQNIRTNSESRSENAAIPDLETVPTIGPTTVWKPASFSRRDFARLLTGASMMTGIAFLTLVGKTRAWADHLTPSTISNNCYKPVGGGGTNCCSCGSDVASWWCNVEGWHKHHVEFFTGINYYYNLRTSSCHGLNAWRWIGWGNGDWQCSDGTTQYYNYYTGWGPLSNTVCPSSI